ncbi:hypothetical protein [Neoroseomonas soli]|uniref:Uncharacterized protein n=1 Tax=Neoroseomonas soli TaxID=1081025 RepID=A0A9X9WVM9_9PROT|nr:hypothetical protein [Neoroseomonas soli]MBR0671208.1 hypothetical protein [Neoroseomonas soli]
MGPSLAGGDVLLRDGAAPHADDAAERDAAAMPAQSGMAGMIAEDPRRGRTRR